LTVAKRQAFFFFFFYFLLLVATEVARADHALAMMRTRRQHVPSPKHPNRWPLAGLGGAFALALCACGNATSAQTPFDASLPPANPDASGSPFGTDAAPNADAALDAGAIDCTYGDGGAAPDAAARFHGSCANGCPPGTICAVEIGGVAGGGGEYCAPIPDACRGNLTCACLATCACGSPFGRAEKCADPSDASAGALTCDNGIR
jgi:hypothetical protein